MQPSIHNGFYRRNGCPFPPLHPSLHRGLVASYAPLLGPHGNKLFDWSGYGRHGTLTNMDAGTDWVPASVRGVSGYALDFDGTDDYVQTPNHLATLPYSSLIITVKIPVGTADGIGGKAIYAERTSSGPIWKLDSMGSGDGNYSNSISFVHRDNSNTLTFVSAPGLSINDGKWHTIAVTKELRRIRLYYDGIQVRTRLLNGTDNVTATFGSLFRDTVGLTSKLTGQCGSMHSFNRTLTAAEVQLLSSDPLAPYRYEVPSYETAVATGFNAAWARRNTQLIGGGCL